MMYDSFDMACHDASSALQLNIKVNSENLLPNAQKYDVGSLRLPADPSWPKIPQRRLVDDLDGIIEPPCVVTLTGTPRKSRTTVRTPHCHQSGKLSFTKDQVPASFQHSHHKVSSAAHPIKRRPGCADPRFKRVTTVKSEVTSNDPPNRDKITEVSRSAVIIPNQTQCTNENVTKTVPEKDTDPPKVTQREAEKPGEIRGMDSIGVQTMSAEESSKMDEPLKGHTMDSVINNDYPDVKKIHENVTETDHQKHPICEILDSKIVDPNCNEEKKSLNEAKSCEETVPQKMPLKEEYPVSNLTIVPNNSAKIQSNGQPESTCLQYCQSNTGQIFFVVENKAQSLSALQMDPSPVPACQYTTQCYNVQVPVLTYQNLPLQISNQTPGKIDIPSQLSVQTIPSTPSLKNLANQCSDNCGDASRISEVSDEIVKTDNLSASHNIDEMKKEATSEEQSAPKVDFEESKKNCFCHDNKYLVNSESQQARKVLRTPPIKLGRKFDDNYKFENVQQVLSDTTDSELYSIGAIQTKPNRLYPKETSCSGSDCDVHLHRQSKFKSDLSQLKKKRRKGVYCSTVMNEDVLCSRSYDDNCQQTLESSIDDHESSKTRENIKQISRNQRKMKSEQNLSRNLPFVMRNYKNVSDPHLGVRESFQVDEEGFYSSSYPNTRRKRDNRYQKVIPEIEKFNNRDITDRTTDVEDSDVINCETHRTHQSNNEVLKKNTEAMLSGKPTSLPAKTQQLLNKSYMEYYDKLRSSNLERSSSTQQRHICQMAVGAPLLKKKRAESHAHITKINEQKDSVSDTLTMEKLSALSNIINRNLNPAMKNSSDVMQTTHLYVNENMKSSSDPTAGTESAVLRKITSGESADLYDSSVASLSAIDRVKRKREKPVERRLLKLKTIAFFGFMMYAMIVLLPLMYNFFLYDDYEDYEDLSYIELMLEYVVSSFREAFGGLFDTLSDFIFRPVRLD